MKPVIFTDFDRSTTATQPNEKVMTVEHTFVIDSRQRDCCHYPNANFYKINLGAVYKNITSIELKGSVIPRSSYNVHSTNNCIDFSIGSGVTDVIIVNGGTGYTAFDQVVFTDPSSGTTATGNIVLTPGGTSINDILVTFAGSGYINSDPPLIYINSSTGKGFDYKIVIGTHYTATLRPGQYSIGGNNIPPSVVTTGLILEIQNAMNYAVNGPPYDPISTGPFEVRLMSQYPMLGSVVGTPEYYNTNACEFNRIQISNTDTEPWELLFCTGPNKNKSSCTLLGFNFIDYSNPINVTGVSNTNGALFSTGYAIRAENDYDLLDDPKYVLLSFWDGSESFERLESLDSSINRKFGTMIFDSIGSNTIKDTTGTIYTSSNVNYLVGPVTKGVFWGPPGFLKALRGYDLDQKKLEFSQPIGKLSSLFISFTKFGPTDKPDFYDFAGKDHMLIFSVKANDNKSGQKA